MDTLHTLLRMESRKQKGRKNLHHKKKKRTRFKNKLFDSFLPPESSDPFTLPSLNNRKKEKKKRWTSLCDRIESVSSVLCFIGFFFKLGLGGLRFGEL
jgi:DUF2075 family protein